MKRKTSKLLSLLIISIFLISGCSKKEQKVNLSENDQKLEWQKPRSKSFGEYDFVESSEEKAKDILIKKLDLEIPKPVETIAAKLNELLIVENKQRIDTVDYYVRSTSNTVMYTSLLIFNDMDGNYLMNAEVNASYYYNNKVAYLKGIDVTIKNLSKADETVHKNLPAFLKTVGEALYVDNLDKLMTEFEEKIQQPADQLQNKKISLCNTMDKSKKEKAIGRNIGIKYDQDGVANMVYIYTNDFSNK